MLVKFSRLISGPEFLKWSLLLLLTAGIGASVDIAARAQSFQEDKAIFRPAKLGAGGFIRGISIAPDGTKVVKTDTYGAWTFDPGKGECGSGAGCWRQCVTSASMPPPMRGVGVTGGAYEIVVAPSQSNTFYMYLSGLILVSHDRCASWAVTGFPKNPANPNTIESSWGRFLAVDPVNANIVYAGTPYNGVFSTSDGGSHWTRIPRSAIPFGTKAISEGGGSLVAFDPSSPRIGGATQGIYVSSYGAGVFHSPDGGKTWAAIPSSPTTHRHMVVDQTGVVWLVDNGEGALYRLAGGVWTKTRAATDLVAVAVNPENAKAIYAVRSGGSMVISNDGGESWTNPTTMSRRAIDIPWLATTNESYMTAADIAFDPSQPNVLYFAQGIGVWRTVPPTHETPVVWTSQSAGIEQLVVNQIASPWGGRSAPVVAVWDRCVFDLSHPNRYPENHGTTNAFRRLPMGWSVDWASQDPSTLVAMCHGLDNDVDTSGYSLDGGQTWKLFGTTPNPGSSSLVGGCIAASSSTNFLWISVRDGGQYYTTDAGVSWNRIAGGIGGQTTGWPLAYYIDERVCAADRASPNTFYVYNFKTNAGGDALYISKDGGATWSQQCKGCAGGGASFSGPIGYNNLLKAEPGRAGTLFFSAGWSDPPHPASGEFYRSKDFGQTWTALPHVREVWTFGFGAPKPEGSGAPAVFIVGWVNNQFGIWRSDDDCATWVRVSDGFPGGSLDFISAIEGDSRVWGTMYVGFHGSGAAIGQR